MANDRQVLRELRYRELPFELGDEQVFYWLTNQLSL